jgi:hypothetical protein
MSDITPEMILAYLDGADLPHVAAYLRTSPEGAMFAADYATLAGDLTRALYRHECPPTQQLGDYVLALLPAADRFAVAAHVDTCPHCTGELAQIRAFLAVEADPPPLGAVERVRRLVTAVFAPPPATAYAALRGDGDSQAQTYQAEDITITLDIAGGPRRDRSSLTGLIWRERDDAEPLAGERVTLLGEATPALTATIDEFGNFAFDDVPHGSYRLEVAAGDALVAIGPFSIGR